MAAYTSQTLMQAAADFTSTAELLSSQFFPLSREVKHKERQGPRGEIFSFLALSAGNRMALHVDSVPSLPSSKASSETSSWLRTWSADVHSVPRLDLLDLMSDRLQRAHQKQLFRGPGSPYDLESRWMPLNLDLR